MASKKSKPPTDDNESDSTILIRVYINKEYLKRENFDASQDIWKLAELERDAIEIDCLRQDIPQAFRKAKSFKPLFKSDEYEMKFYSYDPQKADIEIEDDDDLQTELETAGLNISDNSDSDDVTNENKYLKLRVVFEKNTPSDDAPRTPTPPAISAPHTPTPPPEDVSSPQQHHEYTGTPQHHPRNPISSSSSDLQAPQLRLKRMRHYFLEEEQQNASRIAISAELEWNVSPDTLDMYPSASFTFRIKENLKFKAHEYVSQIIGKTCEVLSPLDVNEEYEFQINMFDEQMPSLPPSPWSDPLRVRTPSPPHRLPTPTHVQVTTLLPRLLQLRWDAGFAPEPQHTVTYIIKEYLQFGQHPFVAQYAIPVGKLSPLEPNTRYQVTLYTSYNGKDSPESKALAVVTPPQHFSQMRDYKPSPPNDIQQRVDEEYNEIVLFWSLPPNTFGNNIHYLMLDLPQNREFPLHELPCRIPIPIQRTPVRIVTVTSFDGREYRSNPTQVVLQGMARSDTIGGPSDDAKFASDTHHYDSHKPYHTPRSDDHGSSQLHSAAHDPEDEKHAFHLTESTTSRAATPVHKKPSIEAHQFSVIVDYIHDSEAAKQIVFNKKIDFAQFEQRLIHEFGIATTFHNVLQIGLMRDESLNLLSASNFTIVLPQLCNKKSQIRLYIGMKPEIPIVESLTSKMMGQFNIKLKQTLPNTFKFAIQAKDHNDLVRFEPNSTTSLHMVINGLKPKGQYAVRVMATNIFGKSRWSKDTAYRYPNNTQETDAHGGGNDGQDVVNFPPPIVNPLNPNDGVLKADPSVRYVFFFADKALTDSNYCLNPFKTDEYHPFYIVDKNRYAYLCIYQDRSSKDDARNNLMFNIVTSKFKSTHQQKNKLVKNTDCWPRQDPQTLTWTMRGGETLFYIDFNNWNNWTKHNHYESIATCIMNFILGYLGKELAPLSVLRIIFKTYHFLSGTKRSLLKKNSVRNIFSKALNTCYGKIRSVKTWKEMSTILICLAALWSLETPQRNRYVGDTQMSHVYSHLCNIEKRGSTHDILDNIRHTYGEYTSYFMDKLAKKILDERQQITKYGYCLWYNVLHCVFPDPKATNAERITSALYPTNHIQHLFALVSYDLTFAAHNRAVKMEFKFVQSLLSSKKNSSQQLSSRVKYDFIVQILSKLPGIEQVYSFILSFKTELRHLLGNDTESWFGFVYYMLSVCKIPKNEKTIDLQLSGAVTKSMELTSDLFCYKVLLINEHKDAKMLYTLCSNYPVIMDEKIRQSISSNTHLNIKPIFIHLLQPSFNNKLLLIKDKESQQSIRIATGTVVGQSWATLDNKQQQALQSTCDELIQQHEFHTAASIINGIMQSVDMFSKDKTDADIVLYLASANGGQILKLLNKYKDHEELGIECHINSFLHFWKQALSNVEEIMNHFVCINAMVQKFGGIAPKSIPQYVNQNEGFCSMDQDDEKNPPKVIVDDTIKSILKTHSLRLKDWRKDEAVLQSICNSDDIINSNFEDEKQDADSTQSEQLLHQQSKCNDLIRTQSARLESLPQNVREVFVKQRAIKDAVKQHELISKQRQDMLNQIKREYSECNRRRKDLQHQLVNVYKQFNVEMNQESILLQQQRQLEEKMDNEGSISLITTEQYDESTNIISSYQLYQKNTRIFVQKVQDRLRSEWDKREQEWWEWT
eukprot:844652_1